MRKTSVYILAAALTAVLFAGCASNVGTSPPPNTRTIPRTRTVPDGRRGMSPQTNVVTPRIIVPGVDGDGVRRGGMTRDGINRDGAAHDGINRGGMARDGVTRGGVYRDGAVGDGVHSRALAET